MGFRLQKSKNLTKHIRLSVGRNGPALSVGRPGARVSFNKDGLRGTVGIPGTGVSYTKEKSYGKAIKKKDWYKKLSKILVYLSIAALLLSLLYSLLSSSYFA